METQSSGQTLPPPPVANEEGIEGTTADNKVMGHADDRSLLSAALKGRWEDVKKILQKNGEAMTVKVMTVEQESITLLDVAVIAAQDQLVEKLVKHLPSDYDPLILRRALCNAARGGRIRMVKALVDKIKEEPESVARALSTAISWAPTQKDVISYLADRAPRPDDDTMSRLILAGHLDIAYLFLKRHDFTPTKDTELDRRLGAVVSMMSYFRGRARFNFWEKSIHRCIPQCLVSKSSGNSTAISTVMNMVQAPFIKRIAESKLRQEWMVAYGDLALIKKLTSMETSEVLNLLQTSGIVLDAASRGITEFVKLCLEYFPELMWKKNFTKELIEVVVKGRHVELFRLVNAYNTTPYLTDDKEKEMRCDLMEAVVKWSPGSISTDVSGAAFLTQRELQWFKVVEDRSDPSLKSLKFKVLKLEDKSDPSVERLKLEKTKDRTGKTFWEVFVDQRQDLLKEAGQWMKDTSSSCSVVATLVTTVAFAAAFTVPGGNHGDSEAAGGNQTNSGAPGGNLNNSVVLQNNHTIQNTSGTPIFLRQKAFTVFAISDALALFSSVTATLMFLAILTSRYGIEDFLYSLPRKMILGLTFLFLSLAFMMTSFGSALTIVLNGRWDWIYLPITLMAAIPVILSAILQLPLYAEMIENTFWPPLYRPKKIWK